MQKDYVAILTIPSMPSRKIPKDRLVAWLRSVASEIKKEKSSVFAKPCRFRLMK